MRSISVCDGSRIMFSFERDKNDEDRCGKLKFDMCQDPIFVELNGYCSPNDIHPDLIGVAAILLCNPFVGESLELPLPVSEGFIQKIRPIISKYRIEAQIDSDLSSLEIEEGLRPALAFSGGADSSAALAVMPRNTIPIFLNRPLREGTQYNSEAPLAVCQRLRECGYGTIVIDSDLEYIRDPVGFPTDLAHSIPAILLSRSIGINSISFGTVMESGYGIGHEHFVDYQNRAHWRFFNALFDSVGIELSFPTLGISEVGTAIICNSSPIAALGQSCIRGSWGGAVPKMLEVFQEGVVELLAGVL